MSLTAKESIPYQAGTRLSFEQEHIWNKKWMPNIPPMGLHLTGTLNSFLLRRAFRHIVSRHEILRTSLELLSNGPRQIVWPEVPVQISVRDLSPLPEKDRRSYAQSIMRTEAEQPFDLTQPPLIRVGLVRFSQRDHVLFFTMHHSVCDLWAMKIFLQELADCYNAYVDSREPQLPVLALQYSAYASWQNSWFQGQNLSVHLDYWRTQLQGLTTLSLPNDCATSVPRSNEGAITSIDLPEVLSKRIGTFAKGQRVSLFMLLLCAFQILVARYTGESDVIVSSLIANRNRSKLEPLIGVFANRVAFRTSLTGNPSFYEALGRVRNVCLDAYEHSALSLWKVVDLTPDLEDNASTRLLFALQDVPSQPVAFKNLEVKEFETSGISMFEKTGMAITGRYDQSWEIWKRQDSGLRIVVSYQTDLFTASRIKKTLDDYTDLLATMVAHPYLRVMDTISRRNVDTEAQG